MRSEIERIFFNDPYRSHPREVEFIASGVENVSRSIAYILHVLVLSITFIERDEKKWTEYLPTYFSEEFSTDGSFQYRRDSLIEYMDLEFWKDRFEIRKWQWLCYSAKDDVLRVKIFHDERSHYLDLLYIIIASGVDPNKIFVKDSLFGDYPLDERRRMI